MKEDYKALFKPEIVNSISGLSIISRVIVDGFLSGLNQSRRVGSGIEFSQYRGYEPGDDLRLLDWKMLARSGKYVLKQSEIDTHINVKFMLDGSASMLHTEGDLSKVDFSKIIIAALAQLAIRQGDAVGLFTLSGKTLTQLQPAVHKQHFNRLLHQLTTLENNGKWPAHIEMEQLHDKRHKEIIFFITDLYEATSEITEVIKELKTSRNEVVVLHLMGKQELAFDYKGHVIFEDLETGVKRKVNARDVKVTYLDALEKSIDGIKESLLMSGISYELFHLDDPIPDTLQLFLKKRQRLV